MRFEEILLALTLICGVGYAIDFMRRRKSKATKKNNWVVTELLALFPVLVLVLCLRSFLYEPFRIPTGSMKPTLLEGDFILVNKFAYGLRLPVAGNVVMPVSKPKTGDIVVFRHSSGQDLIKRVVGVPGDRVSYNDRQLYVNEQAIPRTFIEATQDHGVYTLESKETIGNIVHDIYDYPQVAHEYRYRDVVVPANSYFVMGDNRSNSKDSREWGFVSDKDLLGKAVATWMSWDSNDNDRLVSVRWSRIGKSVYVYADPK